MDYLEFKELYHHGVKGQKWGVRRYQNPDGTLTDEGKAKYGYNGVMADYRVKQRRVKKDYSKQKKDIKRQHKSGLMNDIDYQRSRSDAHNKYINDMADVADKSLNDINKYANKSKTKAEGIIRIASGATIAAAGIYASTVIGDTFTNRNVGQNVAQIMSFGFGALGGSISGYGIAELINLKSANKKLNQ